MILKRIIVSLSLWIGVHGAFAQAELHGKVSAAESGEPLPGAVVYIPELQKGSVADKDGIYQIKNLPKGRFSVQISYLGYATQTRKIVLGTEKQELNFRLSPTLISLNPDVSITAIGYSSQHENAIKVESKKISDLRQQAAMGIMNQLSTTPGIDIISKGPGIGTPVIRGLSQTNILVLNNGVRMENYQFSENHPFMIDGSGISKVEIIKGPASLLYGSDAIGGVVNFIKERPAAVGHLQADAHLGLYSNTGGIGTGAGVKGSSSKFSWGVRGNMQGQGDYEQAENGQVPNSRFQRSSASVFMGSKQKYGSFFLYYDYEKSRLGLANPALEPSDSYTPEHNFQDLDYHLLSSRNKLYFSSIKLEFNMAYQNNRRRLFGNDKYMVDMTLQAVNYEVKAHISPAERLNAIAGLQGNYTQSINAGAPNEIIPDYFSNDFSLFGLAQYKAMKSLNLQAGIRYDFRNIYIPVFQINDSLPPEDLSRNYKHLSFTLGGTLNLGKYALLRLNLASAFRSPNVAELTQDGMHGNRYEQGNINLSEQKSLEADLGLHIHRKHWVFDISGFYNQLNNYIYLQRGTDTTSNGYPIYRYTQSDAAIYGLETGVEYAPWKMLNIKGVYNFTIGKQSNGMYLPFIPQNKIKMNIRLHKQKFGFLHKAFVSIGGTYAFAQDNPAQFETAAPDYGLLHAGLGFSLNAGKQEIEIGIYGENLTNTAYIDHLSTLKDMGYYNMGRNFALKIRIPLDFRI